MQTKQVVELLTKHLSGDLTETESVRLTEWIQASEENATLFHNLNDPDFLEAQLCRFESVNANRSWKKLMDLQENAISVQVTPRKPFLKKIWPLAAAAVILLLSAVWLFSGDHSFFNKNRSFKTQLGEKLNFRLPDGSQVILNSGSHLSITEGFNKTNREIHLTGEAYFDIAPKASLPFTIHTRAMKLSVLGTAFNVRAYPEEKAEVTSLLRGKVEITVPEKNKGAAHRFILVPYQKLIVEKQAGTNKKEVQGKKSVAIVPHDIQIDSLKKNQLGSISEIAWMENRLVFDNEPLSSVAARIEKWYGIKTIIESPELEPITCTGSFETEPLDKVLESMQFSIPMLKFRKVEDNTVLILYK
ncbi:FecR family protein [Pseudoflavitalea rhizosphaerae]|uniref:FecR family protein n=1 Tax=Pseudoflavitalea rhizosphaerae TaxID=1884793 RepID=UPI000F8EB0F0|nr:FecR domain-containing protein [Pseudoflavitalea rhizosphaerae]